MSTGVYSVSRAVRGLSSKCTVAATTPPAGVRRKHLGVGGVRRSAHEKSNPTIRHHHTYAHHTTHSPMSSSTHRYRRRSSPLPPVMATVLLLVAGGRFLALGSAASTTVTEPLVPLDTATLTSNMRHWTTDYAVMFYAPWCQHCK